jgi:RNA recognition motif-containing protein
MVLYVGNIDFKVTSDDLIEIFTEFGTVVSAKIIHDRDTGRSKGFAFVEMGTADEGKKAISQMDGALVEGRSFKVNEARPRENNGGGFNGGGHNGGGHSGGGHNGGGRNRW